MRDALDNPLYIYDQSVDLPVRELGSDVRVYVVDSGVDPRQVPVRSGYSALPSDTTTVDCNGHGTHTAGLVASAQYGIAQRALVVPVRVLDCGGSGTEDGLLNGLQWILSDSAKEKGRAVILLALAGGVDTAEVHAALQRLIDANLVVISAAGNDGEVGCTPGGNERPGLVVGSATPHGGASPWAVTGECVDVFAPGEDVWSTWLATSAVSVQPLSGSSQAAAVVAGAVAAVWGDDPTIQTEDLLTALTVGCGANVGDEISMGKLVCLPRLART